MVPNASEPQLTSALTDEGARRRSEPASLVVVIDDHALIASALRDLVASYSMRAEVRCFSSISASLQVLRVDRPVLVILDLGLPDVCGEAAIHVVRRAAPDALIAVLSGDEAGARAIPAIRSGAIPFMSKGWRARELQQAVHALLERCGLADGPPLQADRDRHAVDRLASLSPRQREILRLLSTGRSNQHIAEMAKLSPQTVKTHLRDIFAKLQVNNRTQAVMLDQSARGGAQRG
jgi:DNA-binding NarL/FixJ family response regulator